MLKSDLTDIALAAPEKASRSLLRTGATIVDVAKQLCPVLTGALRQSIGAEPVDSHTVLIGSDKEYSVFVEFGTSHQEAQPFLTPAFSMNRETFATHMAEEFSDSST